MGAGASAAKTLTPEQDATLKELQGLSPEAQQELAAQAMRDVLSLASMKAIQQGSAAATWTEDLLKVPVPAQAKFEAVSEMVAKIPMVGAGLAKTVMEPVEKVAASFADCSMTVCENPKTMSIFSDVVASINVMTSIKIGESEQPDAYTTYLMESANEKLWEELTAVVAEVLKTHDLTKLWGQCCDGYNAAASKLKQEPLAFDLPSYVVEQTLRSVQVLIAKSEAAIRAGEVGDECSESIKKVFGGGQPVSEDRILPLCLVPKGDARACTFGAAPTMDPAPLRLVGATRDLTIVSRSMGIGGAKSGPWRTLLLGVGVTGDDDKLGIELLFKTWNSDPKFLVADVQLEAGGDKVAMPLVVVCNRFVAGQDLCLAVDPSSPEKTFDKSRHFIYNADDNTISPAGGKKLVLGLKM